MIFTTLQVPRRDHEMAASVEMTPRSTGWTPPAAKYHEEYYPVQSFAWIGKSGGAATDFPRCGDADYDQIENTGIAGLGMPLHGDDAYLVWRVPQQMSVDEEIGVQLVYTSNATPAETTQSTSGKVSWKLDFARVGEGSEMSGIVYRSAASTGTDFQEINYSGNLSYSGEAKLMTSSWAGISGYVGGSPQSGSNFRHGDLVIFKITRTSGSIAPNIPVTLLGATIRYQRDRL
jgi:hypothetical protein